MGSSEALPLEYMGGGGDSGGGFFIQKGKTYVLVGICNGYQFNMSTQTGYYGSVFTYTRISALYKWIIEQVHKK
jgi:secreted trypsin-like serine protease